MKMFNPSRDEVRRFFIDTWAKHRAGHPLEGLETVALGLLLEHPEYHPLLEEGEKHIDRDWSPDSGVTNPFLHLSLHLAVEEQLSVDQPFGIRAAFDALSERLASAHDAKHAILECLGETIWKAQRHGTGLDANAYVDCIRSQAGEDAGPPE